MHLFGASNGTEMTHFCLNFCFAVVQQGRLKYQMMTNFTIKLKCLPLNLQLLLSAQMWATKYLFYDITFEMTLGSPALGSDLRNMSVCNPLAVSVGSVRLSVVEGEWLGKMKSADARKPSGNTMATMAAIVFWMSDEVTMC